MIARAALALLLIAAPAAARERGVPPATPAGKPISCVQLNRIRETRVRDDKTIDFFMYGKEVYRNTLPYSCPELGFEQSIAYKTSTGELCSVDTITVLRHDGGLSRGAACGLGAFQPVTGLKR